MAWITPITDRTLSDALYALENQSLTGDLKGALNISDLNRIEGNCIELQSLLMNESYFAAVDSKTDWIMDDIPYLIEHINRIRQNVINLTEGFLGTGHTPTINIYNYLDYKDVNNLEITLLLILDYLDKMILQYNYCGTLVCGEVY